MDFREWLKKYRFDLFYLGLILIIYSVLCSIFWAHQGSPIVDSGREAYIPSQILKGKILFKDLFILYGPLSYQINAILFKFLGESLNTLYLAGSVNAGLIAAAIYFISRNLTDRLSGFWITLSCVCTFFFFYFVTSYIFPYAYAISYALTGFLLSVLFTILYLKSQRNIYVFISLFFAGLSVASKVDFIGWPIFLFLLLGLSRSLKAKELLYSVLCFLSVPILSFGFLFFQGLNVQDLANYAVIINKYFNSGFFRYFHTINTGMFFNPKLFVATLSSFISYMQNFVPAFVIVFLFLTVITNKFQKYLKFRFNNFNRVLLTVLLLYLFPYELVKNNSQDISLSWLPLASTLILLSFIFVKLKNSGYKPKQALNLLSIKDQCFMVVLAAGILEAWRSYFYTDLYTFGTFLLIMAFVANVIFLIEYVPLDKRLLKISCLTIIVLTGMFYTLRYLSVSREEFNYPVKSERGYIYTSRDIGEGLAKTLSYVQENIPAKASFLMIPEGPILNFLADRDAHGWYYNLTPNFIEVFGEDKILQDLEKNPPDYIMINNRDAMDIGLSFFGEAYGFKIYRFILENYKLEKELNYGFKVKVYKLKRNIYADN